MPEEIGHMDIEPKPVVTNSIYHQIKHPYKKGDKELI
jgi:hypothetical protein